MKGGRIWVFLIFILFGVYFINSAILFYPIPEIVSEINKWIILIGGVLIIIGGISFLRNTKKKKIFNFSQ